MVWKRKEERIMGMFIIVISAYFFIFLLFAAVRFTMSWVYLAMWFLVSYILFVLGIALFLGRKKLKEYLKG